MRLAEISIGKWADDFIVVGEFDGMMVVTRTFKTYKEALKEMVKIAAREEVRYESGISGGPYRQHDIDKL